MNSTEVDEGWVEFVDEPLQATVRRNYRLLTLFLVVGMPASAFLPPKGGGDPLVDTFPWFVVVPGGLLLGLALSGAAWLWFRFAYAPFAVDRGRKALRICGRTRTFADLTKAGVVRPGRDPAELALHLSVTRYLSVTVLVRGAAGSVLEPARRDVLTEMIHGSSITRPMSTYDPTGNLVGTTTRTRSTRPTRRRSCATRPGRAIPAPGASESAERPRMVAARWIHRPFVHARRPAALAGAMQTFLPYADFDASARVLDDRRLGKQRVETLQVMKALTVPGYGWQRHPVTAMWRGFRPALMEYQEATCAEWSRRGKADTCLEKTLIVLEENPADARAYEEGDLEMPPWLGREELHLSHRSKLLAKAPEIYREWFPEDPADLDYIWPA